MCHVKGVFRGILAFHLDDLRIAPLASGSWRHRACLSFLWEMGKSVSRHLQGDGLRGRLEGPSSSRWRSSLTEGVQMVQMDLLHRPADQLWLTRLGRGDLAFGILKVQQMAGGKDPATMQYLGPLVGGSLENMVFLRVSGLARIYAQRTFARWPHGCVGGRVVLDGDAAVNCAMYRSAVLNELYAKALLQKLLKLPKHFDFIRVLTWPKFSTPSSCFPNGGGL